MTDPDDPRARATLQVWGSDPRRLGGRRAEVDLFCLEGLLQVGDRLVSACDAAGKTITIDAEVLEIRFFEHLIDELQPVFSARVLVSGDLGIVADGWTVSS